MVVKEGFSNGEVTPPSYEDMQNEKGSCRETGAFHSDASFYAAKLTPRVRL
jgi:hypothetical protein